MDAKLFRYSNQLSDFEELKSGLCKTLLKTCTCDVLYMYMWWIYPFKIDHLFSPTDCRCRLYLPLSPSPLTCTRVRGNHHHHPCMHASNEPSWKKNQWKKKCRHEMPGLFYTVMGKSCGCLGSVSDLLPANLLAILGILQLMQYKEYCMHCNIKNL